MTDKIEWGKEAPWNAVYHAGEGCEIWQQTPCGADVLIADVSEDAVSFGPAIAEVPAMVAALRAWVKYDQSDMGDVSCMLNYADAMEATRAILARIDGGAA